MPDYDIDQGPPRSNCLLGACVAFAIELVATAFWLIYVAFLG